MNNYKFDLGNSTKGALGLTARIKAHDEQEALNILQQYVEGCLDGFELKVHFDGRDNSDRVDYINLYLNSDGITMDALDREETRNEDGFRGAGDDKEPTFIRMVDDYQELHRDRATGIAWVECGKTGNGYSAHPNIDETGSIKGMVSGGHWRESARVVHSHGHFYNIDVRIADGDLDEIAAHNCLCVACSERRWTQQ